MNLKANVMNADGDWQSIYNNIFSNQNNNTVPYRPVETQSNSNTNTNTSNNFWDLFREGGLWGSSGLMGGISGMIDSIKGNKDTYNVYNDQKSNQGTYIGIGVAVVALVIVLVVVSNKSKAA